jgi:hypothetical protein
MNSENYNISINEDDADQIKYLKTMSTKDEYFFQLIDEKECLPYEEPPKPFGNNQFVIDDIFSGNSNQFLTDISYLPYEQKSLLSNPPPMVSPFVDRPILSNEINQNVLPASSFIDYMMNPYQRTKSRKQDRANRKCSNCETTASPTWRLGSFKEVLCNACGLSLKRFKRKNLKTQMQGRNQ